MSLLKKWKVTGTITYDFELEVTGDDSETVMDGIESGDIPIPGNAITSDSPEIWVESCIDDAEDGGEWAV